ncbi:MAG: hypothetical protein OXG98_18950 [Gemmatimonadetes bacterium]|nr:hypothetical protein [Gemmatimonadota bacterium]
MRSFVHLSFIVSVLLLAVASCSKSNPISQTTGDPQERVVSAAAENKLALLSLNQRFNDLGQYVVEGRIKNLLYNEEVTSITIRVSLYTSNETLIDEEDDTIYRMYSREETTFETETWQFELDNLTPDPDETVITMLIDGTIVSYEDRRGDSGSDTAGRYDFRWSRWGDSKDEVESKEPGTLTFTRDDGMDETGTTTDVLKFTETVFDTVAVRYRFMGNELWGGGYVFSSSVSDSLKNALRSTLNERYGISENVDGNTLWKRNEDTWVVLYPETTESNMILGYFEESMLLNLNGNNAYNTLPLRVVVPE